MHKNSWLLAIWRWTFNRYNSLIGMPIKCCTMRRVTWFNTVAKCQASVSQPWQPWLDHGNLWNHYRNYSRSQDTGYHFFLRTQTRDISLPELRNFWLLVRNGLTMMSLDCFLLPHHFRYVTRNRQDALLLHFIFNPLFMLVIKTTMWLALGTTDHILGDGRSEQPSRRHNDIIMKKL